MKLGLDGVSDLMAVLIMGAVISLGQYVRDLSAALLCGRSLSESSYLHASICLVSRLFGGAASAWFGYVFAANLCLAEWQFLFAWIGGSMGWILVDSINKVMVELIENFGAYLSKRIFK